MLLLAGVYAVYGLAGGCEKNKAEIKSLNKIFPTFFIEDFASEIISRRGRIAVVLY
jgi:hypothetical protein